MHRYLEISLNDLFSFNDFSMYWRSSRVRCLWFPGIKFDIRTSFTATGKAIKRIPKNYAVIKVQCARFNSTYARVSSTSRFDGRILKYISGGDKTSMKCLEKALFLITMGGSLKDKVRREQLEAMKTVMVGDRIRNRAKTCEVYAFDEMTRGYGNDANRDKNAGKYLRKVFEIAKNL